ncbi:hypothetical protein [Mesorhizobium sp. IMUNJ 23232]|uniref:hypothetical protein n=1 Tax=Mesorhizobium sp. IMUNJ 23232 TaxID=3376064 RepID=UPI0037B0FEC2
MNAYLDIFSDVLRLVTFQQRQRPMRREFFEPDGAFPGRVRQSRPTWTGAANHANHESAGGTLPGR